MKIAHHSTLGSLLEEWDQNAFSGRRKMLTHFVQQTQGMTESQLEKYFFHGASLVLTRISAWFRLSYLNVKNAIPLQLKAFKIFCAAGQKYIIELLEVGVHLSVIDILSMPIETVSEESIQEVVELLLCICEAGTVYRDVLYKCNVLLRVGKCLSITKYSKTRQSCFEFLLQYLEEFSSEDVKICISKQIPTSTHPAQVLQGRILKELAQRERTWIGGDLLDSVLQLLKNPDLQVQHEALEVLIAVAQSELVHQNVVQQLVSILHLEMTEKNQDLEVTFNIQQEAASRGVYTLCKRYPNMIPTFVRSQVIRGLFRTIGNVTDFGAQVQAVTALREIFDNTYSILGEAREHFGSQLIDFLFKAQGETRNIADLKPSKEARALLDSILSENISILRRNDFTICEEGECGVSYFGTSL
eukprot:m.137198 g.137198  ORF g.137198 m.137198 type:complete len:415 (-) comp14747_c0_seq5:1303-2547(-)